MFHMKKKKDPKGKAPVFPVTAIEKAEKTTAAVQKAAKEARRTARHGERDIDKEIRSLERSEKALVADIKRTAKTGNQSATRTLAKQMVALRGQKERLMTARARITGVGYAASSAATQASLAGVMGNVTGVMRQVNDAVSTEETAKIMQQFALQNEKMGMSEDMMNDALIDAFDGDGVEAEADGVVDQVLAEIGLDIDGRMVDAPTNVPAVAKPEAKAEEEAKLDSKTEQLLAQLDAL